MFTGSHKDLRISQHYQAEMQRQADQYRLAEEAHESEEAASPNNKWILRAVLTVVVVLAVILGYGKVHAHDARDAGDCEPFPKAMLFYRLGSYYLVTGDYERAVDLLSQAINLMPSEAFVALPRYSVMYWTLGDAQERAGTQAEALDSYRQFLLLAVEDAAPWTFEKVEQLQARLDLVMLPSLEAVSTSQ